MTSPTAQRKPRVLVVDDEPGVLMTLAANLELEGFEVLEAPSPQHALELADREDFDVLLTDIRMPGMNGIELLREMKRHKPELCAIIMTAFALEQLVEEGISEGAYTVLRKPFDIPELIRAVTRAARRGVIMIIDDTPEVTETLAAALETVGIATLAACSGAEALEKLGVAEVDTCVVDLVMPAMGGPQVCQQIRERNSDVVLVAMTGQDVPDMVADAASAGSYACLRKPFEVQALLRTVVGARRDLCLRTG